MTWKATIHHLATRTPGDLADVLFDLELPFVPTRGMMLRVTSGGELLEVDYVEWDVAQPGRLEVWIVEPGASQDVPDVPTMQQAGWRLDPERMDHVQH